MGDAPLPHDGGPDVELYDTTLRDGAQRPDLSLSVADKLAIAGRMADLGVDVVEGGWPGANPKDTEFFARVADGELDLGATALAAFGMTRAPSRQAEDDPQLAALLAARTPVVTLVGKSWGYHVDEALGVAREENLAMVADSVAHVVAAGRRAVFDAEHFFDGHDRDPAYALEVVAAAAEAGASTVVLCDTNGGAMPWTVGEVVDRVAGLVACDVGLHFHDDGGCAVANTLLGVEVAGRAGVRVQVQGTANGIGERCGNADLLTLLGDLQLKRGLALVPPAALERLTELSHHVAELCNDAPPRARPYVGTAAFAHKAGLHASALAKAPDMYNHVDPSRIGNAATTLVSELAGRANVVLKGAELGIDVDREHAAAVLALVKDREARGWSYEAADASFGLLLRRALGEVDEPFTTQHFRVTVGQAASVVAGVEAPAEAILSVDVGGQRRLGAGEGNGPVDALDHAFRNAVAGIWPQLDGVHLADYRVRILDATTDATSGTGAVTRVLVTATDGHEAWTCVGVDPNIVEASWRALSDAYTHAILRGRWSPSLPVARDDGR